MKENLKAAGILAVDLNTGQVLLVKRSHICTNPNTWATVGGMMDPNEDNPRETATREFKEEVQPDEPYRLSKKPLFISVEGNLKFYTYIGFFDSKFVPILNEENTEYGWFDIDSLPEEMLPACALMFRRKKNSIRNILQSFRSLSQ